MCFLAAILACASILQAQEPARTVDALNAAALQAYRAKNYSVFLAKGKEALALDPSNPRLAYNVACGQALQGNAAGAVRILDELVRRKLDLGAAGDADFAGIRKAPEWAAFEKKLAALRTPLVRSRMAFKLADPNLLASGLAVDKKTGDVYVASVRERKIVRRAANGAVSDFVTQARDGFLAGASLAIDDDRRILYASTSAVPFMLGYRKQDAGQAGVFAFDLNTGKLLRKAMLPVDGKLHFLNALAIDRTGVVYVSDSGTAGIYDLKRGAAKLETFVGGDVFHATQGLAFSSDEKLLYVADYSDGLWALDVSSRRSSRLPAPPDVWLGGMDGLSRVPGGFITVQIGVQPERVLRLRLGPQGDRIAAVDILEMNHPAYSGPVQGVVSGNAFLYIANSQLALGNGETGAFAAAHALPTVVLKLPLQ